MDKWLLTAEALIPVCPPQEQNAPAGATIAFFQLFLTPGSEGDVIKFIPKKSHAEGQEGPPTWSETRYALEVTVEADEPLVGIERSLNLIDGTLDLISFLVQRPSSLVSRQNIVNLTQKSLAEAGQEVEETIGLFAEMFQPDEPFPPAELLAAPEDERVKAALRWYRKAMLSKNWEDRFLAFYIVLELLSPVIEPEKMSVHICQACGERTGIAKTARAGILFVLTDILHKDAKLFDRLAKTRAKIVHGAKYGSAIREVVARDIGLMTELATAAVKHVLHLEQEGLPQPPPMQIDPDSGVLVIKYRRGDKSP